jgi:hypothetical protein
MALILMNCLFIPGAHLDLKLVKRDYTQLGEGEDQNPGVEGIAL